VGDVDRLGYNNGLAGDRFSPLRQITPANAAALRAVCTYRLGERVPMESGPVVIGGTLYVTTARRTYAIDAATCALRWKHTYDYTPSPPYDLKVNRGLAYADGRLFRGANDGRVYALDAHRPCALERGSGGPVEGRDVPRRPGSVARPRLHRQRGRRQLRRPRPA
jgi:alcohol dehydrogenase (cytochrome c)